MLKSEDDVRGHEREAESVRDWEAMRAVSE